MTNEEVAEILDNLTYKPNWKLSWDVMSDSYYNSIIFNLSVATVDPVSKQKVSIDNYTVFSTIQISHMTKVQLIEAIFELIEGTEVHEAKEWFRWKGTQVYDTHPEA